MFYYCTMMAKASSADEISTSELLIFLCCWASAIWYLVFNIVQALLSRVLMWNLSEATPNSSQRSGLVKANSAAISYNSEKRRNSIQDLQNTGQAIYFHYHQSTKTQDAPRLA